MLTVLCALVPLVLAAPAPVPVPNSAPASEFPSGDALSHYALGRLLEEQGEPADALGEYLLALRADPRSVGAARRVSEVAAKLGDAARSLEFADRALELAPGDARAQWLRGAALFQLGRMPESLASLEAAVRADSSEVESWRALARAAEASDRIDLVSRAWSKAVELDEDDAEAWFQLAAAEARLGQFGRADSALAIAVELNPLRPGIFFLQGWIQESTGHRAEAMALYRRHLQVHDADQVTRKRLVNLLVEAKRYPEAFREAQRVTRARPEDPEAVEVEADLAWRTGHASEAAALVRRLETQGGDDPDGAARAVTVLARHKRNVEAVAAARRWSAAHATDYRGPLLVARALLLTEASEPAFVEARRAVALAPDSLAPRLAVGGLYQNHKRWSEAARTWEETLEKFPGRTSVELDLAFCREQLGDIDGAERAARLALDREPDNPSALNFLGYLFADHNRNLSEAEGLVKRALQHDPDNGAYIDSMGWVYYRLGRLRDARERLEEAVKRTGGDPVVREHLGDVYKDLSLFELARDQYRQSLARDAGNDRVRAKLAGIR